MHCHFLKIFHIQYHFFTIYILYTQKVEFYIILTVTMLTERPDFHNKHQTQTISKPLIQKHLPRLNIPSTNKNTAAKLMFNLYTFMHKNNPTSIQSGILINRAWSSGHWGRERERVCEIKIREEERKRAGFRDATTIGGGGDASLKLGHVSHKLIFRER